MNIKSGQSLLLWALRFIYLGIINHPLSWFLADKLSFSTGPLIWAPLSEVFGRRTAVFHPYSIGAVFAFGSATAKDTQT
jgi:hypothetical protein